MITVNIIKNMDKYKTMREINNNGIIIIVLMTLPDILIIII